MTPNTFLNLERSGVGKHDATPEPNTAGTSSTTSSPTAHNTTSAGTSPTTSSPATHTTDATTNTTMPFYPTNSSNIPRQGSISAGALAGGVVGAALAGALIAFLITFLIMSSRRKRHKDSHPSSRTKHEDDTMRSSTNDIADAPLVDPRYAWEQHLPQPSDDETLRQAVKTLYNHVELHVENFYSNTSSSSNQPIDETKWNAAMYQVQTPYLLTSLPTLLEQVRDKIPVIKHCIAYIIISGIDINIDFTFPLLPTELTSIARAVARGGSQNKAVLTQALFRHGQLSNYLLTPITTTLPHYPSLRDKVIASAVDNICTAFEPWATNSRPMHDRIEHLTQILREASELGIMLCGQPARFLFNWKLARPESRKIVILPAFIKLRADDRMPSSSRPPAKDVELVAAKISEI